MRRTRHLLITVLCVFLLIGAVSAQSLSVEKLVQPVNISAGDNVQVLLRFTNPFGVAIPAQIVDKNVIGGNGLDIQCLDYTLPANNSFLVAYEPIQAYESGEYTLDKATITYTNPATNVRETVTSNTLKVIVNQSSASKTGQQSGITTIYQCGGTSIRSTSYSSTGSSTSISISSSGQGFQISQSSPTGASQTGTPQPQQQVPQQSSQDMSSIKQEMQQQMQAQEAMEKQLQQVIENSTDFQRMAQQLQQQGYNLSNSSINPVSNTSGSFEYNYQKDNKTAYIRGDVNNSTLQNLSKWTAEDQEKLKQMLEQNPEFKSLQSALQQQGYNLSSSQLTAPTDNKSSFSYQYLNSENKTGTIQGEIDTNGTVTQIQLKKEESNSWTTILILILLAIAAVVCGLYVYNRYLRKQKAALMESKIVIKPVNPVEEALRMLQQAKELFRAGEGKEAYTKVSEALRLYFKHALKAEKEMSGMEVVNALKTRGNGEYTSRARECLALCDLVEFAKYRPNEKDFNRIVEIAMQLIV